MIATVLFNKKFYTGNHLIVFVGESNSGGYALNSDATSDELSETTLTKIWDNQSNTGFLNLKIGTPGSNNLIGHNGISPGVTHGWELQISNLVKQGFFKGNVFLCKTGQGGSAVTHWVDGTLYNGVDCWQTFLTRTTGAKNYMNANEDPYKISVFMSIGINDSGWNPPTDPNAWYTKMLTFCANIRNQLPNAKIYATHIPRLNSNEIGIDNKITQLASDLPYFTAIKTDDATYRDVNHWDYSGVKLIANRMCNLIR